ncbi:hypothetical protein [Acetatifactor muris]|uniref:hypothetical protein n=1 Tax=Acetatifactor muris TaxID=879566 RepID=UPI0023F079B6|nr:hypothetical protein [Acetatifactor muris]
MDVYHDSNIWGKGKTGTKLTALPVSHSFLWEEQEILIPAVYVGKAGAVLDICARIPVEDMAAFLKKWDYERRMSLRTPEEFEMIDADNPGSRELAVEICLDGVPLVCRMSSSLRWYPENIIQLGSAGPAGEDGFENNKSAVEWMEAYGCDRGCCWYFERLSYNWDNEPILSPQRISLAFRANLISVTAGHFSTDLSCNGEMVKTAHPITGQEYTLTLHRCEQIRNSFAEIGAKGVVYPEYCQVLSYSIEPEIDSSLFDIRDCAESDHPEMGDAQDARRRPGGSDGPTAVFMAGRNVSPDKRMAVSSLHFEPVPAVQWRMVFRIKPKDDMEISFPVKA